MIHLGCMASPNTAAAMKASIHLHAALVPVCERLLGVDVDLSHRNLLTPNGDRHAIVQGDICDQDQLAEAIGAVPYDLVIAGEVLEHLTNPGLCLTAIGNLLPSAMLIVTVPNCLSAAVAARAAIGVEAVHADHVCWYSPRTICRLLEMTGWVKNKLYAVGIAGEDYGAGNVLCPSLLVESTRT